MTIEDDPVRNADLIARLISIGEAEGGPFFGSKPDRWYETPTWRCYNDHVSSFYIGSEQPPYDRCPACREAVYLTFPEDRDGPLPTLEARTWDHYMREEGHLFYNEDRDGPLNTESEIADA